MSKQEPGCWKYVRINGQYRLFSVYLDHDSQIKPGETAESAGTIAVYEDYWKFLSMSSMTLKIGAAPDDQKRLTERLGVPYTDRM